MRAKRKAKVIQRSEAKTSKSAKPPDTPSNSEPRQTDVLSEVQANLETITASLEAVKASLEVCTKSLDLCSETLKTQIERLNQYSEFQKLRTDNHDKDSYGYIG
jgi:hypothetical protein